MYWFLKAEGVGKAEDVARSAERAFGDYPHWQTSGHQEQELRKAFYKGLIGAGVDGIVELVDRVMTMLRKAS